MLKGLYFKLASNGIRKNRQLYFPYLLTCVLMIMMHYIIVFLRCSNVVKNINGGYSLVLTFNLGGYVIAIFSMIFLYYTNSFLIRRRNKELGLYNILGMGKKSIGLIIVWEVILSALITLSAGLILGIAFSKMTELALLNIVDAEINMEYSISSHAFVRTLILYMACFLVILIKNLWAVYRTNAVQLFHSEQVGEKPPKANWFCGITGIVILVAAYYIAVNIKNPLSAMIWFFIAVIMVIVATYLVFISGSVMFCKILQKNKKYYYKKNHFVSVASMVYRMKRNGAGLASICILGTMVLVIMSSSSCLYLGAEDSINTNYPRDFSVSLRINELEYMEDGTVEQLKEETLDMMKENEVSDTDSIDFSYASFAGELNGNELNLDESSMNVMAVDSYDDVRMLIFVPLSDYNRLCGTDEKLESDEVMLYAQGCTYNEDTLTVKDVKTFNIKKVTDKFFLENEEDGKGMVTAVVPYIYMIVPDMTDALSDFTSLTDSDGNKILRMWWDYSFNTDLSKDEHTEFSNKLNEFLNCYYEQNQDKFGPAVVLCKEANRADFYSSYGGLFFLGIMLSVMFLIATVLIIYYKQISEGYEDKKRFEIMQKVGMTRKEIRKNVNSQMLTVFLLPPVVAAVHLGFAFPVICKLLKLFALTNVTLFAITTIVSVCVFVLFYSVIYKITSNLYYKIVC